jgi:alanyl-tRNA synthetase
MAAAIERMQTDAKAQQKTLRGMQEKLATQEAQGLIAKGTRAADRLVIVEVVEGWDAQGLKAMAVAAAAIDPAAAIALFTTTTPALVVIAKGANGGIDAGAVLKELVAQFGGKGGGKPDLAQGGGLSGTSVEHRAAARALMG